jgi:hypothetical protein
MNRTGHRGRVDGNQKEIIQKLRECGMQAHSIAQVGDGIPDVLVGFRGLTLVLEVKEPGETLTPAECKFLENWPGQHSVVTSFDDAYAVVTAHARSCGRV